jgi:hypothetical protein
VGTLLLQGLTLPAVIRRLGVQDTSQRDRDLAAELALFATSTAETLEHVEARRAAWTAQYGPELTERAIQAATARLVRQNDALQRGAVEDASDRTVTGAERDRRREVPRAIGKIRRELLDKRREVVLRERDAGALDEEVMRHVLLGIDAEELAMDTNAMSSTRS